MLPVFRSTILRTWFWFTTGTSSVGIPISILPVESVSSSCIVAEGKSIPVSKLGVDSTLRSVMSASSTTLNRVIMFSADKVSSSNSVQSSTTTAWEFKSPVPKTWFWFTRGVPIVGTPVEIVSGIGL